MITNGLMTSLTDEWATPQELFDELNQEFNFDLDVCADDWNYKCVRYFTREIDGLSQDWHGKVWMNPPYGRAIGKWMAKAYEASGGGATVVCLVPARTDTAWWHDYSMKGEIRFIRGRIKFVSRTGVKDAAPFPSAIVIFRGENG
jgi:phage N-6-adenine-methyltransferase